MKKHTRARTATYTSAGVGERVHVFSSRGLRQFSALFLASISFGSYICALGVQRARERGKPADRKEGVVPLQALDLSPVSSSRSTASDGNEVDMIYARRAEASVTVCLMHWSSPEPSLRYRSVAEPNRATLLPRPPADRRSRLAAYRAFRLSFACSSSKMRTCRR